jgi:hypothetical protein
MKKIVFGLILAATFILCSVSSSQTEIVRGQHPASKTVDNFYPLPTILTYTGAVYGSIDRQMSISHSDEAGPLNRSDIDKIRVIYQHYGCDSGGRFYLGYVEKEVRYGLRYTPSYEIQNTGFTFSFESSRLEFSKAAKVRFGSDYCNTSYVVIVTLKYREQKRIIKFESPTPDKVR